MRKHFRLSKKSFKKLVKQGVTVKDFYKAIPLFDVHGSGAPISKTCLLHYIDNKGDFRKGAAIAHRLIARALFADMKNKDKMEIYAYFDWEEDDKDE